MHDSPTVRRRVRLASLLFVVVAFIASTAATASMLSAQFQHEVEPNGNTATATPIMGTAAVLEGNSAPTGDTDFYAFTAQAGDRIHAATMTALSTSDENTVLTVLSTDGVTVLETDDNNGVYSENSSTIAGTVIPFDGTYYLRVTAITSLSGQILPYRLYFQRRSGTPAAETEPNDTFPGTALPAGRWVAGTTATTTDIDYYAIALNAGDSVFLSLDLDPERDGIDSAGTLFFGRFGSSPIDLGASDSGSGTPDSEAFFFTVKSAGTYAARVASGSAGGTYRLSVSVFPKINDGVNCTTYTSTGAAVAIPTGPTLIASTIVVPGNPRIEDLDVSISLSHTRMSDLDVELTAPGGNTVGLFTDIGTSGQNGMEMTLDDEAALPVTPFLALSQTVFAPETNYRLAWFDGQPAGGTWTLSIRDDTSGEGGTLQNWSLRICQMPPPPACPAGHTTVVAYESDFESGDGGFTHAGSQDEWERGLPAFAPITTCASGTRCWKTDLDDTYNLNSNQNLVSPPIALAGLVPPVVVSWSHKYQMENSTTDRYWVDARDAAAPLDARRLFEHRAANMTHDVGNPVVTTQEAAGWGRVDARADALAGKTLELAFHVDSDSASNRAGAAIDDVKVTACRAPAPDLSVTKTDGVASAVPGQSVTYTVVVRNTGLAASPAAQVVDTFPADLSCTWTCAPGGGATCPASGTGNINHAANLPIGGTATFTATCAIAPGATGTLTNTATATSTGHVDPTPLDNSATDTTTLTPRGNLATTKIAAAPAAIAGGTIGYTIATTNAGPSTAVNAVVGDTFAPPLACTWTCAAAGGATCGTGGSGSIAAAVTLPPGGATTHAISCAVAPSAAGTIANTATVTAPTGFADPVASDDASTVSTPVERRADLSVTKNDGVASVAAGATTTYAIVVANAGPSQAPAARVVDTPPPELTCTWTCAASGTTCAASGSGAIDETLDLPAGAQATYSLACTVAAGASGSLTNSASVATPAGVADPAPANNAASDTNSVVPRADLAVTLTDGRSRVRIGQVLNYVVVASNGGPAGTVAALNVQLAPELGTASCTCVPSGGAACGMTSGTGNVASNTLTLPPGSQATTVYSATVQASNPLDSIVSTANIAGNSSVDPVAGNNQASDENTVVLFADNFEAGGVTLVDVAPDQRRWQLRLAPALLADLTSMPLTVFGAYTGDGARVFELDAARLGERIVTRVVTVDADGRQHAQPWDAFADGAPFDLDAMPRGSDVARLRITNHRNTAAVATTPAQ